MKLFVPQLGSCLLLTEPWTFTLHRERRNKGFGQQIGEENFFDENRDWLDVINHASPMTPMIEEMHKRLGTQIIDPPTDSTEPIGKWGPYHAAPRDPIRVTIPKGVILEVERIYIRKDARDFDSMTFRVIETPDDVKAPWGKRKTKLRFWAKLHECNEIYMDYLA
jgi:hypothetical protein